MGKLGIERSSFAVTIAEQRRATATGDDFGTSWSSTPSFFAILGLAERQFALEPFHLVFSPLQQLELVLRQSPV